tara:strand:+ start:1763 stop:2044 length:282 start_codon:yes stop_codon:yes gene_type:complete
LKLIREKHQQPLELKNRVKGNFEFEDLNINATNYEEVFDLKESEDNQALQMGCNNIIKKIAQMEKLSIIKGFSINFDNAKSVKENINFKIYHE